MCRALLAFPILLAKLDKIWDEYKDVDKGYDDSFHYYEKYFRYVATTASITARTTTMTCSGARMATDAACGIRRLQHHIRRAGQGQV